LGLNIKELIVAMKIRPQMFVFPVRVDYIYYYLMGFAASQNRNNPDDVDLAFKNDFYYWAYNWIIKNKDSQYELNAAFWYHMFQDVTKEENEAVELFFKLSEEFFGKFHYDEQNKNN